MAVLQSNQKKITEGGLRIKENLKDSKKTKPLISVITVVFNGDKDIEDTIGSVLRQSYDNLEYIIIDGGSTDRTVDIIKKYQGEIDYWISESDNGIYDAMNKGISLVTGDWVHFLNSSDTLKADVYSSILDYLVSNYSKCDVVAFGYSVINNRGRSSTVEFKPNLDKKWKMPSSHNAMLYKSSLIKNNKFDLTYLCAADFDQFSQLSTYSKVCKNDVILLNLRDDGFIANNKYKSFLEYCQICLKNRNKTYAFYWFLRTVLQYGVLDIWKKLNEK